MSPTTKAVNIVLDREVPAATDRVARKLKRSRSAVVREALREHLHRLEIRAMEERDRAGYARQPEDPGGIALWTKSAVWPED